MAYEDFSDYNDYLDGDDLENLGQEESWEHSCAERESMEMEEMEDANEDLAEIYDPLDSI